MRLSFFDRLEAVDTGKRVAIMGPLDVEMQGVLSHADGQPLGREYVMTAAVYRDVTVMAGASDEQIERAKEVLRHDLAMAILGDLYRELARFRWEMHDILGVGNQTEKLDARVVRLMDLVHGKEVLDD